MRARRIRKKIWRVRASGEEEDGNGDARRDIEQAWLPRRANERVAIRSERASGIFHMGERLCNIESRGLWVQAPFTYRAPWRL